MRTIRAIIVDDEYASREVIHKMLDEFQGVIVEGEADNSDAAVTLIRKLNPDLVLLDIQMPVKDGFYLVRQIREMNSEAEIIFITAFEKYAIQAIKASAFDYLLKPVRKADLEAAVFRLSDKIANNNQGERLSLLLEQLEKNKKIRINDRTGFYIIDSKDIIYCNAESNYTVINMVAGKSIVTSINLGKIEKQLPADSFIRINRSILINLEYLSRVDRKKCTCELFEKEPISLRASKKYIRELEARSAAMDPNRSNEY